MTSKENTHDYFSPNKLYDDNKLACSNIHNQLQQQHSIELMPFRNNETQITDKCQTESNINTFSTCNNNKESSYVNENVEKSNSKFEKIGVANNLNNTTIMNVPRLNLNNKDSIINETLVENKNSNLNAHKFPFKDENDFLKQNDLNLDPSIINPKQIFIKYRFVFFYFIYLRKNYKLIILISKIF